MKLLSPLVWAICDRKPPAALEHRVYSKEVYDLSLMRRRLYTQLDMLDQSIRHVSERWFPFFIVREGD